MSGYVGMTPWSGICPSRLVYLLRPPFGCTAYGTSQVLLCHVQVPASLWIGSVAPWKELLSRLTSATDFDYSGLPDGSYMAIHGWLLPMLDLKVCWRDNAASPGLVTPSTEPRLV